MKFTALLRVKNEARWIGEVLAAIRPICSRVLVMDDHSTDNTIDLALDAGAEVFPSPFEDFNEARDKNALLATAQFKPGDWALMVDGDEVLHPKDGPVLQEEASRPGVLALSVRILYLWDRPDQVRVDKVYGVFRRPSAFRFEDGQQFMSTAAGGNMHCSSVPKQLLGRGINSAARLLHYGYMLREDRIRKWNYYRSVDPNNSLEDGYRHIVQGDLPEFPASATFRHGGPLKLVPLES